MIGTALAPSMVATWRMNDSPHDRDVDIAQESSRARIWSYVDSIGRAESGLYRHRGRSGTARACGELGRPSGTLSIFSSYPALKRWAKAGSPPSTSLRAGSPGLGFREVTL